MSDLIRREDAIEVVCELVPIRNDAVEIADAIRAIPSAERKGEWIKDDFGTVICSECKRPRRDNRVNYINFCNSCGAKMKGAEDE